MTYRFGKRWCFTAIFGWLLRSDFLMVRVSSSFTPDPAFTYTLEVDFSSDAEEEESPLYLESEIVVDSILPEAPHSSLSQRGAPSMPDCLVTTLAFLTDNPNNNKRFSHPSLDLRAFFAADEDDDDDDDHNDDDGHSSMLSNRSLRRSISKSSTATTAGKSASSNAALLIRGGGDGNFASRVLSSDMSKNLVVTALITLVFEGSMGHALEFLKISMQTSQADTSYLKVLREITAAKGLAGLWDGECHFELIPAAFSHISTLMARFCALGSRTSSIQRSSVWFGARRSHQGVGASRQGR
jgi:hypothetical protein